MEDVMDSECDEVGKTRVASVGVKVLAEVDASSFGF